MSLFQIIGPALSTIAFLSFGRMMVRTEKGQDLKPTLPFLLILAAILFRFILPSSVLLREYDFVGSTVNLLDRICLTLSDLGIGLILASFYLQRKKLTSKLFWVPGAISLILAGGIYGFTLLVQSLTNPHPKAHSDKKIEFVLELGPDDTIKEVLPILQKYKATYWKIFKQVELHEDEDLAQMYIVCIDSMYDRMLRLDLMKDRENVDYLEKVAAISLDDPSPVQYQKETPTETYAANDPYLNRQWHASNLNYNQSYDLLSKNSPKRKAKIAIVDTGIDGGHEDLKDIFVPSPGNSDNHSHGTHCAGIAGAKTNNNKGIGSLNWEGKYLEIAGYRALDQYGRGSDETVARAIVEAAEDNADVISLSLGGMHLRPPRIQSEAIKYALSKGAIVVVAAGNSNDDARKYSPANIEGVIVVGAVDRNLSKAVFSNTTTHLKYRIAAPGVDILSTVPGDNPYLAYSGTSMATPMVAGLVGIIKSIQPEIDTQAVYDLLTASGREVADTHLVGKVIQPERLIIDLLSAQ